jgi:DNA polymerase-3 subunit delta
MGQKLHFKELLNTIKANPLQPVYIITGAEDYLREAAIEEILKRWDTTHDVYNSVVKKFGDEIEADELRVLLSSYSLFAEHTFIIIKEARKLSSECWNAIEKFIRNGSSTITLILDDQKLESKNNGKKESGLPYVKAQSVCFDFPLLKDAQLTLWLQEYAHLVGLKLTKDAIQLLKDTTELMLRNYVNEFEKIRLFAENGRTITPEDIAEITQKTRSFSVYEFIDALCEFCPEKIGELLQQIVLFNESVPGILVLITRHLIILLKIKLISEFTKDEGKIAEGAGISPYFYRKYAHQSERVTSSNIQTLLEAVLETDTAIKTGYRSEKLALTLLIHQFKTIFYTRDNKKVKNNV